MTHVDDSRSGTLIVTSTLVSSPCSRTSLLEATRTRRALGGSRRRRRRRRDGSVTLRALLVSGVTTLAGPCAACSYSGGGYYSGCNSPFWSRYDLGNALRNCNPSWHSSETFGNCVDGNGVSISDWDVSGVTDMSYLFSNYMGGVFTNARGFNTDISRWDVSSVTNMYRMFDYAQSFNGDLSNWDVSSVTNMGYMFYYASSFDGDLSSWNTANANNNAYGMFSGATAWLNNHIWVSSISNYNNDGPPDRWCGSNCPFPADGSALKEAVASCLIANPDGNCDCSQSWINCRHGLSQPMSEWDVSRVTTMNRLFANNSNGMYMPPYYGVNTQNFNADISRWNTHSVTDMNSMFQNVHNFNVDLSTWNTQAVTSMSYMFQNAHNFNADISTWNTASVTSMSYMFQNAHNFNADISRWNTQSLAHMEKMFENAHSFDADITKWTCDAYESQRTRSQVEDMFKGADAWHASYVNTHTGYFDLNLGPPNMWVPVDQYQGDSSFFAKDKRVQILVAFVAVLGAGLLGVVVFLIVRCATHRKRTAKKVTTQFRIAHAHNAVSQQQILGMPPMPPGAPMLPGRSPIVVTLPAMAASPTETPGAQQV